MSASLKPEFDLNADPDDSHEETLQNVAARWEQQDEADYRAAHPEAADDPPTETDDPTDDVDQDEDPDPDTPTDDPDGDADGSDEGSPEGDDEEHPEGEEPEDSPDTPKDDDDEEEAPAPEEDEPEEEPLSDDFVEMAKRTGLAVSIDDVPEGPARQLVRQKLANMDAGFTRLMQQAATFRQEQVDFRAEQRFRDEHPELAIIEMLEKNPELLEKVNAQYERLTDDLSKKAFGVVVKDARREATDKVTQEIEAGEARIQRAAHVESLAKRLADKAGLPWEFAESAVERALLRKPDHQRDVTDDEVVEIVRAEARNYSAHVRAHRREASKKVIQDRTANRKPTPGARTPAAAASPKPKPSPAKKEINYDNEDERQRAMMRLAKKHFPGARDNDDE